jgi:hypothetical protein
MSRMGVRTLVITAGAAALWGLAGVADADGMVVETRLPYVPAEVLPAADLPGGTSSGLSVRVDPGDNEAPDPAPRLIVTIR